MSQVYKISTQGLNTFAEYASAYCKYIYNLPGSRVDVVLDRYDGPSIKDGTRKARAKKKKKGKMKYKVKAVPKVVSPDLNLPQGDEFMSFLSIDENIIRLTLR